MPVASNPVTGTLAPPVAVTASTAIYAGKTVVNTVDAITPDIVNKD